MTPKSNLPRRTVTPIAPGSKYQREMIAKAKAEVLREAAKELGWFGAQGNLIEPDTAWAGVSRCMSALRDKANRIERGESE